MGCHDKRKNFHGTPLCLTGAEYAKGETFINCQACPHALVTVTKLDKDHRWPANSGFVLGHTQCPSVV